MSAFLAYSGAVAGVSCACVSGLVVLLPVLAAWLLSLPFLAF